MTRACAVSAVGDAYGVVLRIGAHLAWKDFNDPIGVVLNNKTHLHTLYVEPLPSAFQKLSENLNKERDQHPNVLLENAAACANDHSNITFYSHNLGTDPTRPPQISSTSRENVVNVIRQSRLPDSVWANHIVELHVPCYSVPTLLARHNLAERDLRAILIDAEGNDLDILESIEWGKGRVHPKLLLFEQRIVRSKRKGPARILALIRRLTTKHGYSCRETPVRPDDWWCVHETAAHLHGCDVISASEQTFQVRGSVAG